MVVGISDGAIGKLIPGIDKTKYFLHANKAEKERILSRMTLPQQTALLSSLKQHLASARGNSIKTCEDAVHLVSINMGKLRLKNDPTGQFLHANKAEQENILREMKLEDKEALLSRLRQHFRAANASSPKPYEAAAHLVSISIIKSMPVPGKETDPAKIYTINILIFMNRNIKDIEQVPKQEQRGRDAAEWSGEKALTEGNTNGCVENARVFLLLLRGISTNVRANFVSSFPEKGAIEIKKELEKPPNLQNKKLLEDPPGHAVIEVIDGKGNPFLVDAAMFQSDLLGRRITTADLQTITDVGDKEINGIILKYLGQFDLWIRKEGPNFKITEYPFRQFGKNGIEKSFKNLDELNEYLKRYVSFSDLEQKKIIQYEKDGGYKKEAGEYSGRYIVFSKSAECPFTSQYGPNGSSPTTLKAIRNWRLQHHK